MEGVVLPSLSLQIERGIGKGVVGLLVVEGGALQVVTY